MARRNVESESYRAGKRGRHKHGASKETRRWNDEHLIPERPAWMNADTYTKLAAMRNA